MNAQTAFQTPKPTFLSVCSGLEAASIAWKPMGWKCVGVSEIDPFACKVLVARQGATRPRFMPDPEALIMPSASDLLADPVKAGRQAVKVALGRKARMNAIKAVAMLPETGAVPNFGDMERFKEWDDAAFDVLVGGTPCQAFSIAGFREGLADPRGNLALVYLAILDRYRPEWFLWENVPGVLSSNDGRDFGSFLGGVAKLGYGFAYRVLDAQFVRTRGLPFAVPQRRRRVFVVGRLGDWRGPGAVLFDRESLRGSPPPSRWARKGAARPFTTSPQGGGFTDIAPTMDAGAKDGPRRNQMAVGLIEPAVPEVSGALAARDEKGARPEDDVGMVAEHRTNLRLDVAHSLRAEGFDASEDGSGRGTPLIPVASTLTAGMSKSASRMPQEQGALIPEVSHSLRAQPNDAHTADLQTYLPVATNSGPVGLTVTANSQGSLDGEGETLLAVPLVFSAKDSQVGVSEIAPALRAMGHHESHANGGGQLAVAIPPQEPSPAVAFQDRFRGDDGRGYDRPPPMMTEVTGSLETVKQWNVATPWAVRRLTPVECERLQGIPDDYTNIPIGRRNYAPDGPRYKAIGNSMATNCMEYLGERIELVRALIAELESK